MQLKHIFLSLAVFCLLMAAAPVSAQTTEGKDFWVTFLQADQDSNNDLKLQLSISSRTNANVTIANPFTNYSETVAVNANEVKIVTLYSGNVIGSTARSAMKSSGKVCYSVNSEEADTCALHVTSDQTIALFATNYKKATFDATNVLPTASLLDEYVIQTYTPSDHGGTDKTQGSHFAVVATEDNTVVEYCPSVNTVKMNEAHSIYDFTQDMSLLTPEQQQLINYQYGRDTLVSPVLKKGEVFYVWTGKKDGAVGDLSGTYVRARDGKKIAVFQGCPHTNIPYQVKQRDHLFSQAMPTRTWGNTFVLTASKNRPVDMVRVLALNDQTDVYINGQKVHTIDFSVDTKHYWEMEIGPQGTYAKTGSCVLTTSCPAAVHLFLTSQQYHGDKNSDGDPAMLWINPIEQQIDQVTFATYASSNGTTSHYTNIVTDHPQDMQLDGANISASFQPVSGSSVYYYAQLSLGTTNEGSNGGSHTLKCTAGNFIAHVYGYTDNESYAYSAGGAAKQLEQYILINGEVFTADSKNTLCGKDMIHFVCDLNYEVTSITWNFGDGSPMESGQTAVDHYYAKTGGYQAYVLIDRESSNLCQGQTAHDSIPIQVHIGKLEFAVVETVNDICENKQLYLYYTNTGTALTEQNCMVEFNDKAKAQGFTSASIQMEPEYFLLTVPGGAEQGDGYSFELQINTGCGDTAVSVGFTLPYDPNSLLVQRWDNVLGVRNSQDYKAFQWYKDGEEMAGENGPVLNLHDEKDFTSKYIVKITTMNDEVIETCPYTFSAQSEMVNFTSNSAISSIAVKAGEWLFFATSAEGTADLYDATGKMVSSEKLGAEGGYVRIPQDGGIYVLSVKTDNEKYSVKVFAN